MNTILITFDTDRPITPEEEEAMISFIELQINEPQAIEVHHNTDTIDYVNSDLKTSNITITTEFE
jgi:hypothetical protein